jgi:hypothetical protein
MPKYDICDSICDLVLLLASRGSGFLCQITYIWILGWVCMVPMVWMDMGQYDFACSNGMYGSNRKFDSILFNFGASWHVSGGCNIRFWSLYGYTLY